jgi:hypothetical protein
VLLDVADCLTRFRGIRDLRSDKWFYPVILDALNRQIGCIAGSKSLIYEKIPHESLLAREVVYVRSLSNIIAIMIETKLQVYKQGKA